MFNTFFLYKVQKTRYGVLRMPDRIVKKACLARSGIYQYLPDELPSIGLSPGDTPAKRVYNVYRPSTVLARRVGMFTHLPLTHHHAPERVTPDNFRKYAVGWSGDVAEVNPIDGTGEVGIYSTVTLADDEAFGAYDRGEVQLSPQYEGVFEWAPGVTDKGEKYDVVMRDVKQVNHLALLPAGRGGTSASVLDHARRDQVVLSGLWRAIRRRLAGTEDKATFRQRVEGFVANRAKMDDMAIDRAVEDLKADCATLPDSAGKEKLLRFVADMRMVKDECDEAATQAAKIVADTYDDLDTKAMSEVPEPKKTAEKMGVTMDEVPPKEAVPSPQKEKPVPDPKAPQPNPQTAPEGEPAKVHPAGDDAAAEPGEAPSGVEKKPEQPAPEGVAPSEPAMPGKEDAGTPPPEGGGAPSEAEKPAVPMAMLSPERASYWMQQMAESMSKIVDGIRAELQGGQAKQETPAAAPEVQKQEEPSPPAPTGDKAPINVKVGDGKTGPESLDDYFKRTTFARR